MVPGKASTECSSVTTVGPRADDPSSATSTIGCVGGRWTTSESACTGVSRDDCAFEPEGWSSSWTLVLFLPFPFFFLDFFGQLGAALSAADVVVSSSFATQAAPAKASSGP